MLLYVDEKILHSYGDSTSTPLRDVSLRGKYTSLRGDNSNIVTDHFLTYSLKMTSFGILYTGIVPFQKDTRLRLI